MLTHAVLIAGAAFMLLPFLWMLLTSIRPQAEVFESILGLLPPENSIVGEGSEILYGGRDLTQYSRSDLRSLRGAARVLGADAEAPR